MAIQRLRIQNYRSIANLDLSLQPLNALIGPNNSGKSNILRALNLVLGETWPSRPLPTKDFFEHDARNPMTIEVYFDRPLACDGAVHGFSLCYDAGQAPEYVAVDAVGTPCLWRPGGSQKRVSAEMRSEVALLHLDLERTADRQLRTTQWTLYGKLLNRIDSQLPAANRTAFRTTVTNAVNSELRATLDDAQRVIDDFVRRQTGLDVTLEFEALDPIEVLKGVRPYVHDGMTFDAEEVGAGVQSALAVGIAKAYAEIVRQPLVLAIEEPELYLHPHGCRNFYRLLQELSQHGLQVIYTTHERSFVNAGEYETLHIVRKVAGSTHVTSGRTLAFGAQRERLRLQSKFNDRLNEVFFAQTVVLVEGDPDEIAARCALVQREGFDLDRQSISVMSVGGHNEVLLIAQLLHGLGIPTFALVDEDPNNAMTARILADLRALLGVANVFLQSPNLEGLFGLPRKPSRVDSMTIFPPWFQNPGNATPQVYVDLGAAIRARL